MGLGLGLGLGLAEEDAHQHVVWRGGEGEPLDTQAEEDGGGEEEGAHGENVELRAPAAKGEEGLHLAPALDGRPPLVGRLRVDPLARVRVRVRARVRVRVSIRVRVRVRARVRAYARWNMT